MTGVYDETPAEEMARYDAREKAEKLAIDAKVQELEDAGVGDHLAGIFTVIVPDQMTADWTAERIRDDARTVVLGLMAQRELDLEAERLAATPTVLAPTATDAHIAARLSRENELIDRAIADNESRFARTQSNYATDAAAARTPDGLPTA
jgi:hypothetical protein